MNTLHTCNEVIMDSSGCFGGNRPRDRDLCAAGLWGVPVETVRVRGPRKWGGRGGVMQSQPLSVSPGGAGAGTVLTPVPH